MQSVTNKTFITNHLILTPVTDDDGKDFEVEFRCSQTGDEVTMVCNSIDLMQFATMRPSIATPGSIRIGSTESGALSVRLSDGVLDVTGLDASDLTRRSPRGWESVS